MELIPTNAFAAGAELRVKVIEVLEGSDEKGGTFDTEVNGTIDDRDRNKTRRTKSMDSRDNNTYVVICHPDDGYELDYIKVGDNSYSSNTYTISIQEGESVEDIDIEIHFKEATYIPVVTNPSVQQQPSHTHDFVTGVIYEATCIQHS